MSKSYTAGIFVFLLLYLLGFVCGLVFTTNLNGSNRMINVSNFLVVFSYFLFVCTLLLTGIFKSKLLARIWLALATTHLRLIHLGGATAANKNKKYKSGGDNSCVGHYYFQHRLSADLVLAFKILFRIESKRVKDFSRRRHVSRLLRFKCFARPMDQTRRASGMASLW